MKFNRFYPANAILSLLTLSLMATASIQAQTVQAQPGQDASALPFEVGIYPMNNYSPAIKVNFNNLSGGAVRLIIRGQNGKIYYDEYESTARYRRRFDFSSMPAGEYTVELSKRNKQFTQTFVVDAPAERHIALKSVSSQDNDKNVAVKQ